MVILWHVPGAHWGSIDFNSAFQTQIAISHPSSSSLSLSVIVFFQSAFYLLSLPRCFLLFLCFSLLPSLAVSHSIFICVFIMLTVTCENFKVLHRYSDNGAMTGYTCYDYHHADTLILCSVYYLHQGLVMFYTDRSVIRRTAQNHLSLPF